MDPKAIRIKLDKIRVKVECHEQAILWLVEEIEQLLEKESTVCEYPAPEQYTNGDGRIVPCPSVGEFVLYTDGSAVVVGDRPGGWGFILLSPKGELMQEHSGGKRPATSNEMEMLAVARGLTHVPKCAVVEIRTDSELVVGWLARQWKCNHEHIRILRRAIFATVQDRSIKMRLKHISRCSDVWAKKADNLAREAMQSARGYHG